MAPALVVVVSHTHWDREWYLPFERFRLRLAEVVAELVDLLDRDAGFRHFMLDGQTICLEDVLALRPDLEPRLRRHVASGRLGIGPWYVLADSFLVGGESLVRNLTEGLRVAARFGAPLRVGYLPDAFGHAAQLPRILTGFAIDSAVLWRGVGDRAPGVEWRWRAPGGAEVLCRFLPTGYGNAARLGPSLDEARRLLARERARQDGPSGVVLLMNGNDHQAAQPEVPRLLAGLAEDGALEIVHAGLAEAMREVRARVEVAALPVVEGELRRTGEAPLLPGVLSARSWQKRAHDRAEWLLVRQAEPFCALAGIDRRAALDHAWRLLLACQPHDSICGCSADEVHRDVAARLRGVRQVATRLRDEALGLLAGGSEGGGDHAGVALGNPHPFSTTALARVELVRPRKEGPFRLVGPAGEVPYAIVSSWEGERGTTPTRHLRLAILGARLPPGGVRSLRLEPGVPAAPDDGIVADEDGLSNGLVSLHPVPGGLLIRDHESGLSLSHGFEDEADRGDLYSFCGVEGVPPRSSAETRQVVRRRRDGLGGRLLLDLRWSDDLLMRLEARLLPGERRVELALGIDHRRRNHRLRARFATDPPPGALWTDTPFGWLRRAAGMPPPATGIEDPVPTHPVSSIAVAATPAARVGIAALGLHEIELAPGGDVLLTLLRAVGWMSRSDFPTRRGHAGYQVRTPAAQGRGRLRYRYALGFAAADAPISSLARLLEPALLAPAAVPLDRAAPADRPLLAVEPAAVRLSIVKRAELGPYLVVRLIGPAEGAVTARLRCHLPLRRAWASDLDERHGPPLPLAPDGSLAVPLPAGEIATVCLERA
jgi:hypothetical protein